MPGQATAWSHQRDTTYVILLPALRLTTVPSNTLEKNTWRNSCQDVNMNGAGNRPAPNRPLPSAPPSTSLSNSDSAVPKRYQSRINQRLNNTLEISGSRIHVCILSNIAGCGRGAQNLGRNSAQTDYFGMALPLLRCSVRQQVKCINTCGAWVCACVRVCRGMERFTFCWRNQTNFKVGQA